MKHFTEPPLMVALAIETGGEGPFLKVDGHSRKTEQKMETDYTDFKRQFCHNWRKEARRVERVTPQRCCFSPVFVVLVSGRPLEYLPGIIHQFDPLFMTQQK